MGYTARRSSLLLLWLVLLLFPFIAAPFGHAWVRMVDMVLLYVMLALGLNIVVGFAGLLDLGFIAFYAVGAYTAGLLASPHFAVLLASVAAWHPAAGESLIRLFGPEVAAHGLHLPIGIIVPTSALLAGLLGMLLGAPTLKLRGDYLAVVTLGFGEIVRILINNLGAPINLTDGPKGIDLIDPLRVFGLSLRGEAGSGGVLQVGPVAVPSVTAYYFVLLAACAVIVIVTVRAAFAAGPRLHGDP